MEALTNTFQIKLPQFEGPFDLLLFFIKRDELDIYDIPIHKITSDFLAYVHHLEEINMDQASEFILFISTLMKIKSRMLLPRKQLDPETGAELDPRQELVDKILEYKRFKEISEQFSQMELERQAQRPRGNVADDLAQIGNFAAIGTEIQTISTYRLFQAYEKVLKRLQEKHNKPQHVVIKYNYSMQGQRIYLIELLKSKRKVDFEEILEDMQDRIQALFTFLAILELVQLRYFNLLNGSGLERNSFYLEYNNDAPEEMANNALFTFN